MGLMHTSIERNISDMSFHVNEVFHRGEPMACGEHLYSPWHSVELV